MSSDPSVVLDTLEDARGAFLAHPSRASFETDLDPDDPESTQLRKACRLIEACRTLRENDGFHTSVIEMSFAAIERTLEFYVLAQSNDTVQDFQDHAYAFDRTAALGLLSESTCDDLYQLHVDNRSATYYRDTVATREQADAMFALSVEVHEFTTAFVGRRHECRCFE